MALKESEEEFKLPLRQWLVKKIELKQFNGLEWMDEDMRLFKIPWTQKGHPNWEEHYRIFIAWAKHRGNYNEKSPPDDKKLKGNFRCALTKSDDFEEMKNHSKTNQQMGNYKVFKLLTPEEVTAKKKRKRRRPPSNPTSQSSPPSSLELPHKKPNETMQADLPVVTQNYDPRFGYIENLATSNQADPLLTIPNSNIYPNIPELCQLDSIQPPLNGSTIIRSTLPPTTPMAPQVDQSPLPYYDTTVLLSPSPAGMLNNDHLQPVSPPTDQPSQLQIKNFEQFLQKFNIPRERLSQFRMTLLYEKEKVWEQEVDLSRGIRLMYGDAIRQKAILDAFDKRVSDIDMNAIAFPEYTGSNRQVAKILQTTDLGIVLKTDSKNVLRGTRLCQSHVFYFKYTDAGCVTTKMERMQRIELFSYLKYIRRLIQDHRDNKSEAVDCETVLVIGTKPSTPRSSNMLVSVVLEPILSDLLKEHFNANDSGASLLAISHQTSLDELVRMLDGFDMSF